MGAIKVVGRRALIGRGFLGSVLDQPGRWTNRYHSKNIHEMSGDFDLVVVAAPSASKWWVNEHPDLDSVACQEIVDAIRRVTAERIVLISSIDAGFHAAGMYGQHRLMLERKMPEKTSIIRLPALYGDRLRKNALVDLMRGYRVSNRVFHWYPTSWLWADVMNAQPGKLWTRYSAPLSMWEIAEALELTHLVTEDCDPKLDYNEKGPYTMSSVEVLEDIVRWAKSQKRD